MEKKQGHRWEETDQNGRISQRCIFAMQRANTNFERCVDWEKMWHLGFHLGHHTGYNTLLIKGTTLTVSSLSPCVGEVPIAMSWEDWKAAVLKAASSEVPQGVCSPYEACSPSASDNGLCPPGKYAYTHTFETTSYSDLTREGGKLICQDTCAYLPVAAFAARWCVHRTDCVHFLFLRPLMYRYQAQDSRDRSNKVTTFMRMEHGSRHALTMTVALSCAQGPQQLQSQVRGLQHCVASLFYLETLPAPCGFRGASPYLC
eukprot:328251-Pelagomonas_calceolata.AAC.13